MADERDVELQRLRRKYDELAEDLKEMRKDKQILERENTDLKAKLQSAQHDTNELIRMLAERVALNG